MVGGGWCPLHTTYPPSDTPCLVQIRHPPTSQPSTQKQSWTCKTVPDLSPPKPSSILPLPPSLASRGCSQEGWR